MFWRIDNSARECFYRRTAGAISFQEGPKWRRIQLEFILIIDFMRFALVPPVLFLELGGRFK